MTRAMMLARFLHDQAWRRLDSPGVNAIRVARSVVALLDTAARLQEVPDNHPDLEKLARAGCFRGGVFDPGEEGLAIVRGWELADQPAVPRQDLLAALAVTADRQFPGVPVPTVPPAAVHHEAGPRNAVPLPSAPLEARHQLPSRPNLARAAPVTSPAPLVRACASGSG